MLKLMTFFPDHEVGEDRILWYQLLSFLSDLRVWVQFSMLACDNFIFAFQIIELVKIEYEKFGPLSQCPVTSVVLAVLYEDMGGKLPSHLTDLYSGLLKHMTRLNLLRRGEPMCYDILPDKYIKLFQVSRATVKRGMNRGLNNCNIKKLYMLLESYWMYLKKFELAYATGICIRTLNACCTVNRCSALNVWYNRLNRLGLPNSGIYCYTFLLQK